MKITQPNLFTHARVKLTAWYVSVILIITGSVSVISYVRVSRVLDAEFAHIELRLQQQEYGIFTPRGPSSKSQLLLENLETAKRQVSTQLIIINSMIAAIVALGAYFLSGKTLEPIQNTMDLQTQFISDAAHELKTPITAMRTALEVNLMDKHLHQDTRQLLTDNLIDVNNLENLTKRLLRLSQIDDQGLIMRPVLVKSIIDQTLKSAQNLSRQKQIDLRVNKFQPHLTIKGDQPTLIELLLIFIDNAIKYSPNHSVVTISITAKNKTIRLAISDQGVGITAPHLEHIFDRFYRVESSRNKSVSDGYGLGLSIAKKIIDQHHGHVSVKSSVNQGTSFTIELPRIA